MRENIGSSIMSSPIAAEISDRLGALGSREKARLLQKYFKTGTGEYAEGDLFIGVKVPQVRQLLKEYPTITRDDLLQLLASPVHEERFFALLGLVRSFEKGGPTTREEIYTLYLANTGQINNWDLVDCSAPRIIGGYLLERDRQMLYLLARSSILWERRISVLATFTFINHNQFQESLNIAELLLPDREDLIRKAVGWMLREIGKRNQAALERFLREHCLVMPRTMLRYAIERLTPERRRAYLAGIC